MIFSKAYKPEMLVNHTLKLQFLGRWPPQNIKLLRHRSISATILSHMFIVISLFMRRVKDLFGY